MRIKPIVDATSTERGFSIMFDDRDTAMLGREAYKRAIEVTAERIADRVLAERGAEILAKISADAIATMAIAEAGAAVNDTLKKQHAERVIRVPGETQVYSRGIFGGMRRVR